MKLNYCVVGTNDLENSTRFYDALFADASMQRVSPSDRMTYWLGQDFAFANAIPYDGHAASVGNGTMIGFCVGSQDAVKRYHARAIELGGTCEGVPSQKGPRFSGYVRDVDGNKLCFSD